MKIRECLVSNSSSSSFCIYGTIISEEIIEKINLKIGDEGSIYDHIDKIITDKKLDIELNSPFEDDYYLGRSCKKVKDNQTGLEFKEDVKKQVRQILGGGSDMKFEMYEEAWEDH